MSCSKQGIPHRGCFVGADGNDPGLGTLLEANACGRDGPVAGPRPVARPTHKVCEQVVNQPTSSSSPTRLPGRDTLRNHSQVSGCGRQLRGLLTKDRIAHAEGLTGTRVSELMSLLRLAPAIQKHILSTDVLHGSARFSSIVS